MRLQDIVALRGLNRDELVDLAEHYGVEKKHDWITTDRLRLAIIDRVVDLEIAGKEPLLTDELEV